MYQQYVSVWQHLWVRSYFQAVQRQRICLPNAEVMIHQPLGQTKGQATEIEIAAKHILKTKEKIKPNSCKQLRKNS